jgi:DinB superfamily
MPRPVRFAVIVPMLVAAPAGLLAQQPGGIMSDYLRDLGQTQQKMVALARAMPADKYDWRPGPGVRSVGEVFLHVAADNYFLPAGMGITPPAATGIKGSDYKTADAFSTRKLTKDQIVKELEDSYAFLKSAMSGTTDAKLTQTSTIFGATQSIRAWWLGTLTDMHEHLGQSIAYARMNGVVPPWSR